MGVQQSLLTAFQTAKPQTTRFLKVLIVDEQATLALTIPPKGSDKDDFALIAEQGEISDSQAAYYLCLLDGGKGWLFITYVPDGAKVREKMMYSSSKSRLLKALGEASFTDSLHATSPADLTVRGYAAHLKAQAAPHPLTERERALQEVKQAEYEASKEDAFRGTGGGVRGGAGPLSAVMGVGAGLEWGEGVEEALKEVASESSSTSGDKCTVVGLQIDPKVHTRLNLALSTSTTLDELRTHLPAEGPQYTIFSYLPSGAARPVVVFVYSCPPKSPIRTRMVYSSSVSSLISKIKERAGVEIDKKVETSEPASLTKTEILSELAPVLSRSSAASQPGRSSSLPTPAPIRTNGLARPVGPAHSASFGAADAAAAAKASPSPTFDSPTSVAPDALANPASFAKPKGPPRRTGAGRVAAARAAFESGSSSPA